MQIKTSNSEIYIQNLKERLEAEQAEFEVAKEKRDEKILFGLDHRTHIGFYLARDITIDKTHYSDKMREDARELIISLKLYAQKFFMKFM